MTAPDPRIDLADAVAAIRDQLMDAATRAADERIRFEVGPIQLEFTVELQHDAGAKFGVRAWVLSAGVSAASSSQYTQKISLTLTPKDAKTGRATEVGNDDPAATGLFGKSGDDAS